MGESTKRGRLAGAGFTLIEVMIAGGLIAFIAVALMPAVFSVVEGSKAQGFKGLCNAAVHAKLQEYMNGVADNSIGTAYVPTGFEYSKKRYQTYGYSSCANTAVGAPGFQEQVYTNTVSSATEYIPGTTNFAVMQGFQLWVRLRKFNPRVGESKARTCPQSWYQFLHVGDAIEVTVTGMVRTSLRNGAGVGKLKDVDGSTPNPQLVCSASEIVYPPRLPFRYYLGADGRLRNYQAQIAFANGSPGATAGAAEAHFRSLWATSGTGLGSATTTAANLRSIAISPNNQWVYILRNGELSLYGPCQEGGASTMVKLNGVDTAVGGTVSVDGVSYPGTPDCLNTPTVSTYLASVGPDGARWNLSTAPIDSIAVDFGADTDAATDSGNLTLPTAHKIYGYTNTGGTMQTGGYTSQAGLLVATLSFTPASGIATATWAESPLFRLPANKPRIRGIYMAQTNLSATAAPTLFFFDNSCGGGDSTNSAYLSNCTMIFSSGDDNNQQEMRELPTQVESISF